MALGRRGRGPGGFILPISVTQSPFDERIAVTDLQARRVTFFSGDSLKLLGLQDVAPPVGMRSVVLGRGDTILVVGTVSNPEEDVPFAAAVMAGNAQVLSRLLHIPARMRGKAYLANFIHGMSDQTRSFLYVELEGDGWLYRVGYDGVPRDSLQIPLELYPGFELPKDQLVNDSAIREYFKTQPMARAVRAIDDSTFIVEVQSYLPAEGEFTQTFILISWGVGEHTAMTLSPCQCRLLGSRGDTVAFLRGEPPEPYDVEWRVIQRHAE